MTECLIAFAEPLVQSCLLAYNVLGSHLRVTYGIGPQAERRSGFLVQALGLPPGLFPRDNLCRMLLLKPCLKCIERG